MYSCYIYSERVEVSDLRRRARDKRNTIEFK